MKNPEELLALMDSLALYYKVAEKEPFPTLNKLLIELSSSTNFRSIRQEYYKFCRKAIEYSWPYCVKDYILDDLNPFTKGKDNLLSIAKMDLSILKKLSSITIEDLKEIAQKIYSNSHFSPDGTDNPANWAIYPKFKFSSDLNIEKDNAQYWLNSERNHLKESFDISKWDKNTSALKDFYRNIGYGIFNQYIAFSWQENHLEGIPHPDNIQLKNLFELSKEHKIILENTKRFLQNLPSHNVILYGDRGSGKSSTVKALLHHFAPEGLKMVQIANCSLEGLPLLMKILAKTPHKFIIFVDDLSFEASQTQYKWLKTILEGGLSPKPQNILFYVTSNRHHLVKETFSERQQDEVHPQDNLQEKLSLADRFGLKIIFANSTQNNYLKIVENLAKEKNLNIPWENLKIKALEWALWHNGYTGRSAKQFLDYLAQE